jgi:hypothetical protein
MTITIFTKRGEVRTDFSDEETREIAALDPPRRLALDKLISASGAASAAEATLKTEELNLKQALANQAQAAREVERVSRKPSHHDNFLFHVRHIAPPPPSDAQVAAEAQVEKTAEALAIQRDAYAGAQQAVKDGRASFAACLSTWQNDGQPLPTQNELVRQMSAKFKPTPKPQRPQYLSEIDRVAAASAGAIDTRQAGQRFRRGAGGQRSYPAALRGQRLPGYEK